MEFSVLNSDENMVIVQWKFENFDCLLEAAKKVNHTINSEVFNIGVHRISKWYFQMDIYDEKSVFRNYIGLFLVPKTLNGTWIPIFDTTQEFYIVTSDNSWISIGSYKRSFKKPVVYSGSPRLLEKVMLLREAKTFLPERTLTITCEIQLPTLSTLLLRRKYQTCRHKNFDFLRSEIPADVLLICDDGEIRAHTSVLSEQSSVLRQLLRPEPNGTCISQLILPNISLVALVEMLRFLYRGEYLDIRPFSYELLVSAHKYNIRGLKQKCSESLSKSMTVANVSKILMTAHCHQNKYLTNIACRFIIEHFDEVHKHPDYENMTQNNPQILAKLCDELMIYEGYNHKVVIDLECSP